MVTGGPAGPGLRAAPPGRRRRSGACSTWSTAAGTRRCCAGSAPTSWRPGSRAGARLLVALAALAAVQSRDDDLADGRERPGTGWLGRVDVVRRQLAVGERAQAAARAGPRRPRRPPSPRRCACARSCGGRGRAARGRRTPGRARRAARRARRWRSRLALRIIWPAWLARSGSRSGPNTSTATKAMTANSGSPTPNTGQNLLVGVSPSCMPASPRPRPDSVSATRASSRGGRRGRVGVDDRLADVAALAQRDVERDPAQHGHVVAEALGERGRDPVAAAAAEDLEPVLGASAAQCGQGRKLMFSTTPTTRWCIIEAIVPARSATSAAASCGVVTTTTSAPGRCWPSEIATSPVPGRQVEQQDVEVAPVDVGEHLHQRPVEHRAAPGDDLVAARLEHADRDHRDAAGRRAPA